MILMTDQGVIMSFICIINVAESIMNVRMLNYAVHVFPSSILKDHGEPCF